MCTSQKCMTLKVSFFFYRNEVLLVHSSAMREHATSQWDINTKSDSADWECIFFDYPHSLKGPHNVNTITQRQIRKVEGRIISGVNEKYGNMCVMPVRALNPCWISRGRLSQGTCSVPLSSVHASHHHFVLLFVLISTAGAYACLRLPTNPLI